MRISAIAADEHQPADGSTRSGLAALSHDLRQPLAAIMLLASAASGETDRPQQVLRRLADIVEQAAWLDDVLGLLDECEDPDELLDLPLLVASCVNRAASPASCQISFDRSSAPPVLVVSPPLGLQRALGNLLDNAVRAAGAGGTVAVRVHATRGRAEVVVTDDGPGFGQVPPRSQLGLESTTAFLAARDGSLSIITTVHGGVQVTLSLPRARRTDHS